LRRVTKAHGDMSVGGEKSAEVIVPVWGRTESRQASATAGCRKSSIGKSTQHRRHGGCRTASSAERKGRSERLSDKRTTEDKDTNTTARGALPGNRRMPNGMYGGVRGRLPPRRGQPPTRLHGAWVGRTFRRASWPSRRSALPRRWRAFPRAYLALAHLESLASGGGRKNRGRRIFSPVGNWEHG